MRRIDGHPLYGDRVIWRDATGEQRDANPLAPWGRIAAGHFRFIPGSINPHVAPNVSRHRPAGSGATR